MTSLSKLDLGERHLDAALCAGLISSLDFREAFLTYIDRESFCERAGGAFVGARSSVFEDHPDAAIRGESDVLATWRSADGRTLDVRIEDKADAQFQPRQGERYAARGASWPGHESTTVLIAPSRFLATANVQARFFDRTLTVEQILEWMRDLAAEQCGDHILILAELIARINDGRVLGSKGLHVDFYAAIHSELLRRDSQLQITNRPTDWLHAIDARCVPGVKFVYRIRDAVAEIAMTSAFRGDRTAIAAAGCPPLQRVDSGSSTFLRTTPLQLSNQTSTETASSDDIQAIVDALELVSRTWAIIREIVPSSAVSGELR